MSKSDPLDTINEILDIAQKTADTAVDIDRHQDIRIWNDLNLLMSGDHIDFIHIKVLLPKFLSSYGEYRLVTTPLINKLTRKIDQLHEVNIKIRIKKEFPHAQLPRLKTLKKQYKDFKSQWDNTLMIAMKIVNTDTRVNYDIYGLLKIMDRGNVSSGNNTLDSLAGGN